MKSFYDILEVLPSASIAEIRASYLKLAREYHPDRVPEHLRKLRSDAEEKVKEINEAWSVLSDPVKRKKYDLKLQNQPAARADSPGTARPRANSPPGWIRPAFNWFDTRKDVVKWTLLIGTSTLVLVVMAELIGLAGLKPDRSSAFQPGAAESHSEPGRVIRYEMKPVPFQTSQFAGRATLRIQLLNVVLGESRTVVTFRVMGADRSGFLLYEPPGGSGRPRIVMGKTVVVDRGFEEPYLVDESGTKYYSTSGLLGGDQLNFDLYNFTRRVNVKPHEDVTLSAEFPALASRVTSVTFVLPGLGKWQPEWRWPAIGVR